MTRPCVDWWYSLCCSVCHHHRKGEPLHNQNRKRHCFPRSLSPGNGGNNWTNCGNSTLQWKRNPAEGGGQDGEEGERWKQERTDERSLDRERSGVVSKSVLLVDMCFLSPPGPRAECFRSNRDCCGCFCFGQAAVAVLLRLSVWQRKQ